jgi:hypothetical protein
LLLLVPQEQQQLLPLVVPLGWRSRQLHCLAACIQRLVCVKTGSSSRCYELKCSRQLVLRLMMQRVKQQQQQQQQQSLLQQQLQLLPLVEVLGLHQVEGAPLDAPVALALLSKRQQQHLAVLVQQQWMQQHQQQRRLTRQPAERLPSRSTLLQQLQQQQ